MKVDPNEQNAQCHSHAYFVDVLKKVQDMLAPHSMAIKLPEQKDTFLQRFSETCTRSLTLQSQLMNS